MKKKIENRVTVSFKNVSFVLGVSCSFDRDYSRVVQILDGHELTASDRYELLRIYQVSYHDDGKIELASSCDSSCHGCGFCQAMTKKAESDPLHICNYCYDRAQEDRWYTVRNRHALNMLIMSTVLFTVDELRSLNMVNILRVNSSGDCPNVTYAMNMINIAYAHEWVNVGMWAKNTVAVKAACRKLGKPSNLTLVQSAERIGEIPEREEFFDYVFVVFPDEETTRRAIKNGACECNGRKCLECGFKCYRKGWAEGSVIAEVLRANKKVTSTVLQYYYAEHVK